MMRRFAQSIMGYLPGQLRRQVVAEGHRPVEYREWRSATAAEFVTQFVAEQKMFGRPFVIGLGDAFGTARFMVYAKKWLIEYLIDVFDGFENHVRNSVPRPLVLEDNPLHHYALGVFSSRFGLAPRVRWVPRPGLATKIARLVGQALLMLWISLKNGLRVRREKGVYKVLREAIWGLQRGSFRDDFLVDGRLLHAKDVLLFSRKAAGWSRDRMLARKQALAAGFNHFDLETLPMSVRTLVGRILPVYGQALGALARELAAEDFSVLSSMYSSFLASALPYEAVFSNFSVTSELGHNFFTASHVAESIVCETRGVGYYLTHWSDNAVVANHYINAFLGCDEYLVWGPAHVRGIEGSNVTSIGYYFKHRIQSMRRDMRARADKLAEMGVPAGKKVISFFDETFGGEIRMSEDHYLSFWTTVKDFAKLEPEISVIVKPKGAFFHDRFSKGGRAKYARLRRELSLLGNVHVIDPERFGFIGAIGVADLVVTQGMTSSATIALLCGVDGLYLDQAGYDHPLRSEYTGSVVFEDPPELIERARQILHGECERPVNLVSPELLRRFDAYSDDRGIDRLRLRLVTPRFLQPNYQGLARVGVGEAPNPRA